MTERIVFLTLDEVLEMQFDLIEAFGGSYGIRDSGLLEAALGMPESGVSGEYYHKDVFEMAAAYAFHIVSNHPFVDGNKRVALACALTFLEINGHSVIEGSNELYDAILHLISGEMDKSGFARLLESLASPRNTKSE